MLKHSCLLLYLFISSLLFADCSSDRTYESMVREGLSSGVEADSLFLGYYFGMTVQDFHSESFEMNKRGEITGFTKITYRTEALSHPAVMEFYPTFADGVITRIPVTIGYEGWSPWNEHLHTNKLISELISYYNDVYGSQFYMKHISHIDRQALVSIQGNREIRIYPNSQSTVMVDFIDLSAENSKF